VVGCGGGGSQAEMCENGTGKAARRWEPWKGGVLGESGVWQVVSIEVKKRKGVYGVAGARTKSTDMGAGGGNAQTTPGGCPVCGSKKRGAVEARRRPERQERQQEVHRRPLFRGEARAQEMPGKTTE